MIRLGSLQKRNNPEDAIWCALQWLFKSRPFAPVFIVGVMFGGVMFGTMLPDSKSFYNGAFYNDALQQEQPTAEGGDGWKTLNVFYGSSDLFESTLPSDKKFFSQVKQDEAVLKLLKNKRNGYFVDLASNHATHLSNTYALERFHGWKGLCIEPNAQYWYDLAHGRKNCDIVNAVVGKNRMDEMEFSFRNVFGGLVGDDFDNKEKKKSRKVYTVTLLEIFKKFGVPSLIDYMSLDVEGAEEFIMGDFPFSDYQFRILTVERPNQNLQDKLRSCGYVQILTMSKWGETLWINERFKDSLDMTDMDGFGKRI